MKDKINYSDLFKKMPNRYLLAHILGELYSDVMHRNFLKEVYENPHKMMDKVFEDFIQMKMKKEIEERM
jgi:hypothetical protein